MTSKKATLSRIISTAKQIMRKLSPAKRVKITNLDFIIPEGKTRDTIHISAWKYRNKETSFIRKEAKQIMLLTPMQASEAQDKFMDRIAKAAVANLTRMDKLEVIPPRMIMDPSKWQSLEKEDRRNYLKASFSEREAIRREKKWGPLREETQKEKEERITAVESRIAESRAGKDEARNQAANRTEEGFKKNNRMKSRIKIGNFYFDRSSTKGQEELTRRAAQSTKDRNEAPQTAVGVGIAKAGSKGRYDNPYFLSSENITGGMDDDDEY